MSVGEQPRSGYQPPGYEPPGVQPPGFQPPGFQPPGSQPGASWTAPSGQNDPGPWAVPPPPPGQQPGYPPPPANRSNKTLFIVLGVVGALVVGAFATVAGVIAVGMGGDDPTTAAPISTSSSSSSSSSTSTGPDTSLEAIEERYAVLGANLLDDTRGCEPSATANGEHEHVRCAFSIGDLHLVTYTDAAGAAAARSQAIQQAGVVNLTSTNPAAGYVQSTKGSTTTIYWDGAGPPAVSATLTTQAPKAEATAWWDTGP